MTVLKMENLVLVAKVKKRVGKKGTVFGFKKAK